MVRKSGVCVTQKRGFLNHAVFLIEREVFHKKEARQSVEIAVGLTSVVGSKASSQ